ncbi:uncharacterized protein EKO05_0009964 [Ascochyta rabiei]|uniref:uncharacterized protein n=1 Tax=Didymella rabiei TaxID=5454 RepID=UPI0021FC7D35|nr:uncharacterized protein EKO05_0009964 [Ascochyta rabiei]UPX19710.1 hypothetical protein EKO05_0009964 [Ascochyta rabiei]
MADSTTTFRSCCLTSFQWGGLPSGREEKVAGLPAYVTGDNSDKAVLYVHDALGWRFGNARLLADHYAREDGNADKPPGKRDSLPPRFFGGEVLDADAICEERWGDLDLAGFSKRNARSIREPEIFAAAKEIKSKGYIKLGAAGFCFGGWAVLRLAAVKLVDAIVCAHPSWATNEDFDGVEVPVILLSPEQDGMFSDEMKEYAFKTLLAKRNVPFEWVHFPGVPHGCLTRGNEKVPGEREAMAKGKGAAVRWWGEWLS